MIKSLIMGMNEKIAQNKFKNISGIVVIKNGKLLIEEYFNEGRDTLHDPRSVGKTFASAVMGIAIKDGYIKSEQQTLERVLQLKNYQNYSPKKDSITIKSLLTMSSVFDANDNDDNSPGNENNMYPLDNWVKFALDLKVDSSKQAYKSWNYFTAGIVVVGDILNQKVPGGLDKYADTKLFKPLVSPITNGNTPRSMWPIQQAVSGYGRWILPNLGSYTKTAGFGTANKLSRRNGYKNRLPNKLRCLLMWLAPAIMATCFGIKPTPLAIKLTKPGTAPATAATRSLYLKISRW
jgi:hypothetical protein